MAITPQFSDLNSLSILFDIAFFPLITFSYWSKFHVNLINGFGVMTISFYKGLTRNSEIRNMFIWVLLNIWKLGQAWNTKFGMNASNKMLLNAAKYQGYSFYHFWVIKGKHTGGGGGENNTPPRLGLRHIIYCYGLKPKMFLGGSR